MLRLIRELITKKIKQRRKTKQKTTTPGTPLSTTGCYKELSVHLTINGFSPFSPTLLISLRSLQRDTGITRGASRSDWLFSLMARLRYRRFESRSGIKRRFSTYQRHSASVSDPLRAIPSVLVLKQCVKYVTSQNNEKLLQMSSVIEHNRAVIIGLQ